MKCKLKKKESDILTAKCIRAVVTRAQRINFAAFIGARAFIAPLSVFSRSRSATLVGSLANSHTSDIAVKIKLSAENRFSLQFELQHLDPSGAGKNVWSCQRL